MDFYLLGCHNEVSFRTDVAQAKRAAAGLVSKKLIFHDEWRREKERKESNLTSALLFFFSYSSP